MKTLPNLDFLKKVMSGTLPLEEKSPFTYPPPAALTLGFRLIEIGEGTSCMEMDALPEKHANPMGTIHGGILCDIADAAIGTAHVATLVEGESFTSIDLQINFFRPVWKETIQARAKPVHSGKSVSRYVCDITRADGKLVAQVTSTVMTLRGSSASGR
jgi:uncharacterized protein (TIGR00369 family)